MATDPLTNSDLATLIKSNHDEMSNRMRAVEDQVKQTNGRVKDLEKQEIERQAVDRYKKDNSEKRRYDLTTVITIVIAAGTVIGAMWWTRR